METIDGQSFTYANSYNGDKQPTQSSFGNLLKSFTYDGLGRLGQTELSENSDPVVTTSYTYRDLDATRTTTQVETLENSYGDQSDSLAYTYDARGNIASVSYRREIVSLGPIGPFPTFTPIDPTPRSTVAPYRLVDQPETEDDPEPEYETITIRYAYDDLNELVWEYNEEEERAWNYSYDLGGNILSKTEYEYLDGVVGSTAISTVTYTYGDADWPDLLTAYDGSPITYDAIGNPLSYRGWSFNWQGGRQLASASNGTTSLSFVYNESGLRTEKTVGNTSHRYVYRGSTLVAEITDDYAMYFHHDANGGIVGFTYVSGNTQAEYFYRKNLQGDVIGVLDSTGASVAEYRYDAWGKILEASGSMAEINPIRYRGYYFDQETGLYYLQSRYYDPEIGRFINADDAGTLGADDTILSYNLFAYSLNDPVNRTDDGGNLSLPNWAKVAIGAVATAAAVAVTVATGGAAAPVLIGVLTSTIGGAAVSAISHRVSTGSWEGAGKAALNGAADGFMSGGLCALGGSLIGGAVRTIKNAKYGITIGKQGTYEGVAELAKTRRYSGLHEYSFIKKVFGKPTAEAIGWWQNKCVVKGVMLLKGAIYDCGGDLTGAYAKEVLLTKGYEFLYNIWLM